MSMNFPWWAVWPALLLCVLALLPFPCHRAGYARTLPLRMLLAGVILTPAAALLLFDNLEQVAGTVATAAVILLPPAIVLAGALAAALWRGAACRRTCIALALLYFLSPLLIRACGGLFIMP